MKTHGIKIKPVNVTHYVVTDLLGKRIRTFTTHKAAASWVAGYVTAVGKAQPTANAGVAQLVTEATAKRRHKQEADE